MKQGIPTCRLALGQVHGYTPETVNTRLTGVEKKQQHKTLFESTAMIQQQIAPRQNIIIFTCCVNQEEAIAPRRAFQFVYSFV